MQPRRDEARLLLQLIVIQMAGLAISRYVLRHPLVLALSRETIVREVGQVLQRLMTDV